MFMSQQNDTLNVKILHKEEHKNPRILSGQLTTVSESIHAILRLLFFSSSVEVWGGGGKETSRVTRNKKSLVSVHIFFKMTLVNVKSTAQNIKKGCQEN